MDADGITDKLLASYSSNDEVVIESKNPIERSVTNTSNTSTIESSIDERRARCQNRYLIQTQIFPPQSVYTTTIHSMSDNSSIGSDDVLSYCYESEKSIISNNSNNTKNVFRESEWYTSNNGNTIVIPSTCKTSSSHSLTVNSSGDDETTIYLCQDGSFSSQFSDDDENCYDDNNNELQVNNIVEGSFEIKIYPTSSSSSTKLLHQQLDEQHLKSVRIQSFAIGILIGLLMQFSTLGANFLASSYRLSNIESQIQLNTPTKKIINIENSTIVVEPFDFNFVWSAFTSVLGVFVMLVLRSLLKEADQSNKSILIFMECYITVGVLAGVCLAWIGADVLLNVTGHLLLSLITLGGALLWCKVLSVLLQQRQQYQDDLDNHNNSLHEPLLPHHILDDKYPLGTENPLSKVKICGVTLGFAVGLFIQFSSLGANFLLQALQKWNVDNNAVVVVGRFPLRMISESYNNQSADRIISICFTWSFLTSFIGIILLVVIRFLVSNAYLVSNMKKLSISFLTYDQEISVLYLECFYALGAILGLNAAWIYTDYLLGLESHLSQSICTLLGTLIWCKIVLFCCRPKKGIIT